MIAGLLNPGPQQRVSAGSGETPRILIVDGLPIGRELVRRVLSAEGFQTAVAGNGKEAMETARSAALDLILLEAALPDQSGFEVCGQLQADHRLGDIPVIFFSALDDLDHRLRGLRSGAVDYISKPFCAEEVLARVRVHLRTRRALQCLAQQQELRLSELRQAQRSILVSPEDLPAACFAVCYRPLDAVGGDIYDVLEVGPGLFGYFVADVSGHSVGASFLTSAVKALLRQYSGPLYSAEETLQGINRVIRSTLNDGQYLTACYARYYAAERHLAFISAGHPAPIHVSADGRAHTFAVESDPLGAYQSVVLEKQEIDLAPGDRFYLYTDGLIEDPGLPAGGRVEGLQLLAAACERRHCLPAAVAAKRIVDDLRPPLTPASDDLLLLAVEVKA